MVFGGHAQLTRCQDAQARASELRESFNGHVRWVNSLRGLIGAEAVTGLVANGICYGPSVGEEARSPSPESEENRALFNGPVTPFKTGTRDGSLSPAPTTTAVAVFRIIGRHFERGFGTALGGYRANASINGKF